MGVGPIIGPIIGDYLQHYFGWQACFYFYASYSLIGLIATVLIVPETHLQRQLLNFNQLRINFFTIINHSAFIGSCVLMGLTYSILIVSNTLGPFLIQKHLHLNAIDYGHIAFLLGIAYLLGTFFCRHLLKRISTEFLFLSNIIIFGLISLLNLIISYTANTNIWLIIISSSLLFFGSGIIYPAGMGKDIYLFKHLAGSSSAIMNLINILIITSVAAIMSKLTISSPIPLAWIYLVLMSLTFICYWLLIRKRNTNES